MKKMYFYLFGVLFVKIINKLYSNSLKYHKKLYPNISNKAKLGNRCKLSGSKYNIIIGNHTYINEAQIYAGEKSIVRIGENCSIGYRVSIKARTHGMSKVYNDESGTHEEIEKDIYIGNRCWIGDGVFIKEGFALGDDVIIGANSVVTKNFPNNVIIGGVPAQIIKTRTL